MALARVSEKRGFGRLCGTNINTLMRTTRDAQIRGDQGTLTGHRTEAKGPTHLRDTPPPNQAQRVFGAAEAAMSIDRHGARCTCSYPVGGGLKKKEELPKGKG